MIPRRRLLQMMGIAGATTLLPSLTSRSRAHADPPPIPRRIIFFYTEQGTFKPSWQPTIGGASPDPFTLTAPWATSSHTLGELHQPLVDLKDRLLFLDGLDMVSVWVDRTQVGNAHYRGQTATLTGIDRLTPELASGPSIDQVIARGINSPAPVTAFPSLELYVDEQGQDVGLASYAAAGERVPMIGHPNAVYDRLFPNGPTSGDTPEQRAALERRVAKRRTILDFAKNDFAALGPRLGKADRERLSAHAAAVSDLRNRLSVVHNATCLQPERSMTVGAGGAAYDVNADVMMRLAQTALACDLTRVITISFAEVRPELFGYRQIEGTADPHDLVHRTSGPGGDLFNNPAAVAMVKRYYVYLAVQYAKLLRLLDSIPEADGGTLLDHTAVLWCGEICGGDHSNDRIPYVLGGGLGGTLKSGRYVRYPRIQGTPENERAGMLDLGPAHNDLFVSLANKMGVPITTFGNATVCKGPLAGLS